MIAGDAVVQLLDIFKELELKLETTGLSLSHCSSLCVSGAVAERCPALQEDPDTKFFFIFSSRISTSSGVVEFIFMIFLIIPSCGIL